jgi:hypothetical protein
MVNTPCPKDVEHYAATVNAWFATRLELDKSLLTLSAGGVGVLVTLLTTRGVDSAEGVVLYVGAIFGFLVCIGSVLAIFRKNSDYLVESIASENQPTQALLTRLDKLATYGFGFGVTLAALIGVSSAVGSYVEGSKAMSGENNRPTTQQNLTESFSGSSALRPADTRSFTGATSLKPAESQAQAAQVAPATPATQPSPTPPSQPQGSSDSQ